MIEGCFARPNTSAPRLNTFVATYSLAPLIRLTTAITAATPMTTPMSVSTLRSLCAHRLAAAIDTASPQCKVRPCFMRLPSVSCSTRTIRPEGHQDYLPKRNLDRPLEASLAFGRGEVPLRARLDRTSPTQKKEPVSRLPSYARL